MSIRLMAEVFELEISASEKLVLLALADHADDAGENCFPSIPRIARKCSMTRRGVQKIVRRIEGKEYIRPAAQRPDGIIEYRLTLPSVLGANVVRGVGRTGFAEGANLSAQGGEPGSPESSLTTTEPPRKKRPAAKPARPADPRHQPFVDFAHRTFEAKYKAKPSWQVKDWKGLKNLLASNKSLYLEELQARWQNYLASTEAFTVKQGGSLAYFCAHADSFITGPIFEKGKSNGKQSLADAVEITLASHVKAEQGFTN